MLADAFPILSSKFPWEVPVGDSHGFQVCCENWGTHLTEKNCSQINDVFVSAVAKVPISCCNFTPKQRRLKRCPFFMLQSAQCLVSPSLVKTCSFHSLQWTEIGQVLPKFGDLEVHGSSLVQVRGSPWRPSELELLLVPFVGPHVQSYRS